MVTMMATMISSHFIKDFPRVRDKGRIPPDSVSGNDPALTGAGCIIARSYTSKTETANGPRLKYTAQRRRMYGKGLSHGSNVRRLGF
jgi:hypothetical protein